MIHQVAVNKFSIAHPMVVRYLQRSERQSPLPGSGPMAAGPKQGEEQSENKVQGSTPHLDRLERLAQAAATSAQAKQWRARQNGLQDPGEASEVRNLNHDAEARAQAEAAMQQMMAKAKGTRRTR
jgi:hypothetical protein